MISQLFKAGFVMAQISQVLEPPANPGRFKLDKGKNFGGVLDNAVS
jgi:hypothetical protein